MAVVNMRPHGLFKEGAQRKVVISAEKVDFNARVGKVGQNTQQWHVITGNVIAVFVPELEQIPRNYNVTRGFLPGTQKLNEPALPIRLASGRIYSQMSVRNEVCHFFHQAQCNKISPKRLV